VSAVALSGLDVHRASESWIAPILELSDPIGVLSVSVDADPELGTAWQTPVRAGLRRIVKEARQRPRAERWALVALLDELDPELESLLDPQRPSRGRALFAGVTAGGPFPVELRAPLPTHVGLDRLATALPLVAVQQRGRPAGVAIVSAARLELAEWDLGQLRELTTIELAPSGEQDRGRPATEPAVPQPFPERDRLRAGAGARLAARLREAGAELAREATLRGWDFLIADGDPRLLDPLAHGLDTGDCELVRSPRPLTGASDAETAERVAALLGELRAERTRRLLGRLDGTAATRDRAVIESALEQGRVAHLLLPASREPEQAAAAESLLRRALAASAEVTLVEGPPSALGSDGAAALLRWRRRGRVMPFDPIEPSFPPRSRRLSAPR